MKLTRVYTYTKKVWTAIAVLVAMLVALYAGSGLYMASVVSINESRAKSFDGSIQPMAFVPNWRVGTYIDDRAHLRANDVAKNDYIPLPDSDDIETDFNSYFTYMNMHM